MNLRDEIQQLNQNLARERDELRLQAHLLSKELHDEWEKVDRKWDRFQDSMRRVKQAGKESGEELYSGVKDLGYDIETAYKRIRDAL